jgi:hypothetical protein
MEHKNIIWNPGTKQWFCTTCGRTTDGANIEGARAELDKHKCIIPSLDVAGAAPVTETIRLIRNPTKNGTLNGEKCKPVRGENG